MSTTPQSQTPETNAELNRIAATYKGTAVDAILIHHARKMERERDEIFELLLGAYDRLTDSDFVPPNHELKTWLEKVEAIFRRNREKKEQKHNTVRTVWE